MSNDTELKPCPFCGGEAHIERLGDKRVSCIVMCEDCGGALESSETFNQGAQWNTRPTPSDSVMVNRDDLAAYLRAPHMGKARNRLALALVHTTEGEG